MLPLHSQNTAAIKLIIGQAVPTRKAVGDVFGKQAGGGLPSSLAAYGIL